MCIHGAPAPCGICKLSKGPVRYAVNSSAPKTPEQMAYAAGQRDMLNKVKNSPLSMTGYRIACGINWAFWTVVFTVGVFTVPGIGAKFLCLVLAGLSGWYDYRIWALKARRLTLFIIF